MTDRARPQRRRVNWRRVPGRAVLIVAFAIGIASLLLAVIPFHAAVPDTDTTVSCGPPLFEVVVPTDPAFAVPENDLCPPAATTRVLAAGTGLIVAFLAALIAQLGSRRSTNTVQARWLAGGRRKARGRVRSPAGEPNPSVTRSRPGPGPPIGPAGEDPTSRSVTSR